MHEHQRADLHHQRDDLGHLGLLRRRGVRAEELLVDVAGEQVGAAIDMIAAGTSAPMAMAAKATPTNQDGKNVQEQRRGTASLGVAVGAATPAAMAM